MRVYEEIEVNAGVDRAWEAVSDYPSRAVYSERARWMRRSVARALRDELARIKAAAEAA